MSSLSPAAPAAQAPAHHQFFSLRRVWAIATNTLLELVRLKVFYFLLIFAVLIIGGSFKLVEFSFQEQFQVLKDIALGAMSIFTWLLGMLATAMLLPKDQEDRTLYTILAKPVPRFEYLLGKLLGVLVMLAIALTLMSAVFMVVLYAREQTAILQVKGSTPPALLEAAVAEIKAATFNWNLLPGIILIYLKSALFAAATLFISTFSSSWIFTIMISISVYLIGHLQGTARQFWLEGGAAHGPLTEVFLAGVALLFPDLQLFSLVDDIAVGAAVPMALFGKSVALGSLYLVIYLLLGYFVFSQKEL